MTAAAVAVAAASRTTRTTLSCCECYYYYYQSEEKSLLNPSLNEREREKERNSVFMHENLGGILTELFLSRFQFRVHTA